MAQSQPGPIKKEPPVFPAVVPVLVCLHVLFVLVVIAVLAERPDPLDNAFVQPADIPRMAANPEPPTPPTPRPAPAAGAAVGGVRWRGMEITQGVQVFHEPELPQCRPNPDDPGYIFCNNSIPLVAGRRTLVRVYADCSASCPRSDLTVAMRIFKNGHEQARQTRTVPAAVLAQAATLSLDDLRASLDRSINFAFFPPPDWMTGDVTFEISLSDLPAAPGPLTLTRRFHPRKPLRIAYVPVEYKNTRPPEALNLDYWLIRMYPIPAVEYYPLPVPPIKLDDTLDKSTVLRKLLFTYWLYVQYQPPDRHPDQLFGWLPQEFFNGGVSDPYWCPHCSGPHSSRVAFGGFRPEIDIGGPRILAHEIAHNLGARHAWSPTGQEDPLCFRAAGTDIQVDPDWPYAGTPSIQEFGIDLYSDPPVIYPPAYYDMMAYCARPWISPYTYRKLFNSPFLQVDAPPAMSLARLSSPQPQADSGGTLLVSGVVYPDGTLSSPEIVRLEGTAFDAAGFIPPQPPADPAHSYCLSVQAGDGAELARHCFSAGFADIESGQQTDQSRFFVPVALPAGQTAARVQIYQGDRLVAGVSASNHPPQAAFTTPAHGDILTGGDVVTWQAGDPDGDPLYFDLLYSPDNGQTWLPLATRLTQTTYRLPTDRLAKSQSARFLLLSTDGFHTTQTESGLVAVLP